MALHWVPCLLIFTLAFSIWIYLMHCFITKKFSNFILSLYLNDQLCVCDLSLLYPVFRTCAPREKGFFFFKENKKRKLIILLYNAILLSIWLWHYSLASVISLCLKLFNSDKNSSEEHNYSTRIHYIRTWSVNYFSCLLGWCGGLLMTINTAIISPWLMEFRTGSFSFL